LFNLVFLKKKRVHLQAVFPTLILKKKKTLN